MTEEKIIDSLVSKFSYDQLVSMVGYGQHLLKLEDKELKKIKYNREGLKRDVRLLIKTLEDARIIDAI